MVRSVAAKLAECWMVLCVWDHWDDSGISCAKERTRGTELGHGRRRKGVGNDGWGEWSTHLEGSNGYKIMVCAVCAVCGVCCCK